MHTILHTHIPPKPMFTLNSNLNGGRAGQRLGFMGEVGEQFPQTLKNTALSLSAKCWVKGGVGGQFPRILHLH